MIWAQTMVEQDMRTIASIFVVGGIAFWVLVLVELVLLFIFTEKENGIGALLSVGGFCAVLQFLCGVNLIGELRANWLFVLPLISAYLCLGVVWAVFKWNKYIGERLEKHDALLAEFVSSNNLSIGTVELPEKYKRDWSSHLKRFSDNNGQSYASSPLVRLHKSRIIKWMAMWPLSLTLFMFKDMVTELFSYLYQQVQAFLQEMANKRYARAAHIQANLEANDKGASHL